ncbi:hypothetical protein BGW38_006907 [Lunasporangiospora selenospora]|uniref:Uncharacterized protein n=1 Tax=Lunasporangiospora selenospora TaxID=979761 RepID=A0A9P6FZJ0_9FUNG|nr:hypothetical protein BGW38_006907 [Lunasporangiospora selenospora]
MFLKAILVFCGDIWTCTILIISGSWTSEIRPAIDISIARWIFTACILLSFILIAFDFKKANKVIKSQDISKRGWKHLVVQAPRQVINILTLIAFMSTLGFDLDNLDAIKQIMPNLRNEDKFTFCVMVFTSLMFVFSAIATFLAHILWIPLVSKVKGNLKEYVCYKMDKRIDNIIKKTTRQRAERNMIRDRQADMLERQADMLEKQHNGLGRYGGLGGGSNGGIGRSSESSSRNAFLAKRSPKAGAPKRPKPTLPDIDVILANSATDVRQPPRARPASQRRRRQQPPIDPASLQQYQLGLLQQHGYNHQFHAQVAGYQSQNGAHYQQGNDYDHVAITGSQTIHRNGSQHSLPSDGRVPSRAHSVSSSSNSAPFQSHAEYEYVNPQVQYYQPPRRQASMASARSVLTDGSSPILYPRSIGGRSTSRSHISGASSLISARYYTQQQQFQLLLQQRQQRQMQHVYQNQQQEQRRLEEPTLARQSQDNLSSELEPVQTQQYDDSGPRGTFQRTNTGDPETWPAHYGFASETMLSVSPSSSQHFPEYQPDSAVLPNQSDPYYTHMAGTRSRATSITSHKTELSMDGGGGGPENYGGNMAMSSRNYFSTEGVIVEETDAELLERGDGHSIGRPEPVYRPDRIEMEHYDTLYREITQSHIRVMTSRQTSIRSRSSQSSLRSGSSPNISYARALRGQQQQQQQQLSYTHPAANESRSSIVSKHSQISLTFGPIGGSSSSPVAYDANGRPYSALHPPNPNFMGSHNRFRSVSNASSTTSSRPISPMHSSPTSSPRSSMDRARYPQYPGSSNYAHSSSSTSVHVLPSRVSLDCLRPRSGSPLNAGLIRSSTTIPVRPAHVPPPPMPLSVMPMPPPQVPRPSTEVPRASMDSVQSIPRQRPLLILPPTELSNAMAPVFTPALVPAAATESGLPSSDILRIEDVIEDIAATLPNGASMNIGDNQHPHLHVRQNHGRLSVPMPPPPMFPLPETPSSPMAIIEAELRSMMESSQAGGPVSMPRTPPATLTVMEVIASDPVGTPTLRSTRSEYFCVSPEDVNVKVEVVEEQEVVIVHPPNTISRVGVVPVPGVPPPETAFAELIQVSQGMTSVSEEIEGLGGDVVGQMLRTAEVVDTTPVEHKYLGQEDVSEDSTKDE